ncbi:hypothetical protein TIFTF001_039957 [Ficus carica]|uniref:Retrotransposon gag domain-containing protein n=1 Tax=Ficus carica TaxID=3494 RepID=A0AA87YWR3_FICCA|nr:hypothetical protein TIFTF001_039949 [Ficus carica]GMN20749.1 hypothetical protein TIFTF001_039957 [Ficus carica]
MANDCKHQEEFSQENPVHHPEASTSGANTQIANLTRLVEELTKKYSTQQSQMEKISTENQVLKNQLMALNTQAAYSYYYNPYVGYSAGASAGGWQPATSQNPRGVNTGGWQQATPYYPQGTRNVAHSPVAPMQSLNTPGNPTTSNERRAQQRQQQQQQQQQHPAHGFDSRRRTTPARRSTPDLPATPECPILPGTMNRNATYKPHYQYHHSQFESISFLKFDGMSDPHDHLLQYKHVVQSTNIPTGMLDDIMCKLFVQSLKGAALRWFCNLPPESIDSFDELSLEFIRSYSVHIQSGKTTKDLGGVIQWPHESLRAYIKRFSKAISEILGLNDGTAREALKKGLRHKSLIKNEICARYPPMIQDAMHRAKGFIELEEENERVVRDLARTRDEMAKARDEREKVFRRECTCPLRRTEHRVERTTRHDHKRPLPPPKYALGISPSELIVHLKCQDFVTWPKKLPKNPARDTTKYCEFHKDHGHQTIDCRALRAEVVKLLKKSHLREFLTEKGRETYGLGTDLTEGEPHNRSRRCSLTILSSIPSHFTAARLHSRPYDDVLVLTLNVSNCEVGQILVDNGSSADVLFLSTLREMELSESDIESSTTILTGFNGESTTAVGKIKLPVFAVGENKLTTFLVLDCPFAYNIILGRSWIHAMKAVPSTYHQRIRFPTKRGVKEIKGNQEVVRTCYLYSLKMKRTDRL